MQKNSVLLDSDALVGNKVPEDAHHKKVVELFSRMKKEGWYFVTTSQVIEEVATVLSHKVSQQAAVIFLEEISDFPKIHITPELHQAGLDIFSKQKRKGTSVVDCTNVAVMKAHGIEKIFSFDKAYERDFGVQVVK